MTLNFEATPIQYYHAEVTIACFLTAYCYYYPTPQTSFQHHSEITKSPTLLSILFMVDYNEFNNDSYVHKRSDILLDKYSMFFLSNSHHFLPSFFPYYLRVATFMFSQLITDALILITRYGILK